MTNPPRGRTRYLHVLRDLGIVLGPFVLLATAAGLIAMVR